MSKGSEGRSSSASEEIEEDVIFRILMILLFIFIRIPLIALMLLVVIFWLSLVGFLGCLIFYLFADSDVSKFVILIAIGFVGLFVYLVFPSVDSILWGKPSELFAKFLMSRSEESKVKINWFLGAIHLFFRLASFAFSCILIYLVFLTTQNKEFFLYEIISISLFLSFIIYISLLYTILSHIRHTGVITRPLSALITIGCTIFLIYSFFLFITGEQSFMKVVYAFGVSVYLIYLYGSYALKGAEYLIDMNRDDDN